MSRGAALPELSERIADLERAYRRCRLCPRDCGADRIRGRRGAFCRLDARGRVYKELIHHGEEALLGPVWLLDLGGCSMRCLFCTEWDHLTRPGRPPAGLLSPRWFARRHRDRVAGGARCLSFAGGDPTVSLLAVLRALAAVPEAERLPLVWNCNGWMSELARSALDGLVACWLVDHKFGSARCARRLAGVGRIDGEAELEATLDFARRSGTGRGELPRLLVRHLLMPGHLDCCTRAVIDRVAARWPDATFNLMTGYLPFGPALRGLPGAPELNRLCDERERHEAIAHARDKLGDLLIDGRSASG